MAQPLLVGWFPVFRLEMLRIIGLYHGRIHAQLAALDDLFLLSDGYLPPMELLHRRSPSCRGSRPVVLSSGTLPPPMRVNSR